MDGWMFENRKNFIQSFDQRVVIYGWMDRCFQNEKVQLMIPSGTLPHQKCEHLFCRFLLL